MNIIHRDVKPENILLDKNMNSKLCDFGLSEAKIVDKGVQTEMQHDLARQGGTHQIRGSADYIAPEIIKGQKHDETVDFWALGVLIFEMLVGIPPFNDDTPEAIFENIVNRKIIEWDYLC